MPPPRNPGFHLRPRSDPTPPPSYPPSSTHAPFPRPPKPTCPLRRRLRRGVQGRRPPRRGPPRSIAYIECGRHRLFTPPPVHPRRPQRRDHNGVHFDISPNRSTLVLRKPKCTHKKTLQVSQGFHDSILFVTSLRDALLIIDRRFSPGERTPHRSGGSSRSRSRTAPPACRRA